MFAGPRKFFLLGVPMFVAAACAGQIGDDTGPSPGPGMGPGPRPGPGPGTGPGPGGPGGPGGGGGPGGPPGGMVDPATSIEPPSTVTGAQQCTSGKPGPRLLRRLSAEQFDNTVRDLFRNAAAPKSNVFNDPQVLGFTGDAAALLVRDLGSQQLMSHAEQVARWAVSALAADLSPCRDMTPACRTMFIRQFGTRAFRQTPTAAQVTRYEKLFASAASFEQGLELTITAMLQSPYFLYRRELGEPDAAKPGQVRLTQFEIASNISYLITRSMPDDMLLQAAGAGQLGTRAQIDAHVERLLQDPKHRATMHTFVGEWLESNRVEMVLKDPNVFDLTDAMREDMQRETAALVEDVVFTRKGSLADLLTTNYTFVNATLAKHYGLPAVTGTALVKTTTQRDPGILTQGSILSGHAGLTFSSPTLRGKLVRTRLLCETLPPPPDDVDTMIKVPENAKTTREIFSAHVKDPNCGPCHTTMDPIGFGFENYDVVGRFRTQENGVPVDTSGYIVGREVRFNGLRQLSEYLAGNADVQQCMVRFLSYFAYGAANWREDGCTYDAITAEAKAANWSIRSVLTAITHAPHFTSRVQ